MTGKLIDYTKERGVRGATAQEAIQHSVSPPGTDPRKHEYSRESHKNPSTMVALGLKRDESSLDTTRLSSSTTVMIDKADNDDDSSAMHVRRREPALQQPSPLTSHEQQCKKHCNVMIDFQLRIPPKSERRSSQTSTKSTISEELRGKLHSPKENKKGRFSKPKRKRSKTPVIDSVFKDTPTRNGL